MNQPPHQEHQTYHHLLVRVLVRPRDYSPNNTLCCHSFNHTDLLGCFYLQQVFVHPEPFLVDLILPIVAHTLLGHHYLQTDHPHKPHLQLIKLVIIVSQFPVIIKISRLHYRTIRFNNHPAGSIPSFVGHVVHPRLQTNHFHTRCPLTKLVDVLAF